MQLVDAKSCEPNWPSGNHIQYCNMSEKEDNKQPYELTIQYEGREASTSYAPNPQRLMWEVFQHFERFNEDDRMPVHSEYNQAGQLCHWELNYSENFPKELFPLVAAEHPLLSAVIRKTKSKPQEYYALAIGVQIPNRRYVWAAICDGRVVDWRDFVYEHEQEIKNGKRVRIKSEIGGPNTRVKAGLVKGRTLHIVAPPHHIRDSSADK
jgi:hypothetical protein